MNRFLSTKAVADFLSINEKMVYTLIAEKGLPASKITGKWLFSRHLVEQWVENNTRNYPEFATSLPPYNGLLIIAGSNDPLLDKAINLFNASCRDHIAVFGNLGSMGGLRTLRKKRCHIASSHLMQEGEEEYNFKFADKELDMMPAVVNFCKREQGLLVKKGNPKKINKVEDLFQPGVRIINRPLGTGTRQLFDHELMKAGGGGEKIKGYGQEVNRHLDVGLEILSGRADAGPGIRAVAGMLDMEFLPLRWERYDLLISKDHFFDEGVQRFLGILHEEPFRQMAGKLSGYDLCLCGKVVYPAEQSKPFEPPGFEK